MHSRACCPMATVVSIRDEPEPTTLRSAMIPPFTSDGVLPPGRYTATPSEVEQRFVLLFPTSMTRSGLFDGWMRRREELLDLVEVETEWIDGSFVTAKRDAGDIDIVTLIRQDVLDALQVPHRQRVFLLVTGVNPQLVYGCHSFLLGVCDEGDAQFDNYLHRRGYWDRWWSRFNDKPDYKGYLEVRGDA